MVLAAHSEKDLRPDLAEPSLHYAVQHARVVRLRATRAGRSHLEELGADGERSKQPDSASAATDPSVQEQS